MKSRTLHLRHSVGCVFTRTAQGNQLVVENRAMTTEATGTTRRGRSARRATRQTRDIAMLPALKRGLPLTEPMDAERIAQIDDASMAILEDVGVVFRDPIALNDWKQAGADVRGETVHLDRALVRELIASIPETFTYHARNPAHNLPFGRDHSILSLIHI